MSVRAGSQGIEVLRSRPGDGPPTVVRSATRGGSESTVSGVSHRALDYRRLFEAIPTPCAVMTVDALLVDVNAAYEQVVGQPREALVGRRLGDVFPANPSVTETDAVAAVEASLR